MDMVILDGKALSQQIKAEISNEVESWTARGLRAPHLAAVLVGDDPASQVYVRNKVRSCERVGIASTLIRLEAGTSEDELLSVVQQLNADDGVDGFIVQLPLPSHIDEHKVTLNIDPKKDVDGFHPVNVGRMAQGLDSYLPATPFGILQMMERYNIQTEGKRCVIVGRSNIVGMPMSILLARKASPGNATVTLTHSRTQHIEAEIARADIVVAAIGKARFIRGDMIKDGAVVIDVGINRVPDPSKKSGYRLVGDVHFDEVAPKCSYITPVPGGVGPMTVTSLLKNTMRAAKKEVYR